MRILCLLTSMFLLVNTVSVGADKPKFPYEAIVDAEDGENVWSGPDSKRHYPTARLKQGERVKVYRHDPGGWCQIAPPKGSFSWVSERYIRREEGRNTGAVTENRVVVHVGSELDPEDFTTIQAEVSKGDAVEILDEKTFVIPGEERRTMYKIKPPRGEWRWISRKSIIPVDSIRSSPLQDDQPHPKKRGPVASKDGEGMARPVSTGGSFQDDPLEGASRDESKELIDDAQALPANKQKLADIDKQFREMVQQDPPTWDLDSIEAQYKELDAEVEQPWMTVQIGRRLDSIKRHRKTHQDYAEFFKIVSEARERDAQLASRPSPSTSPSTNSRPIATPSPGGPTPLQPQAPGQPQPSAQPQTGAAPAFDGAGIVQRLTNAVPGGPQFVLISPDGRILSILQPTPGVDLNKYHNKSMGVIGQRYHRDDWNSDVINVRSLQPVQLRTTGTPSK